MNLEFGELRVSVEQCVGQAEAEADPSPQGPWPHLPSGFSLLRPTVKHWLLNESFLLQKEVGNMFEVLSYDPNCLSDFQLHKYALHKEPSRSFRLINSTLYHYCRGAICRLNGPWAS